MKNKLFKYKFNINDNVKWKENNGKNNSGLIIEKLDNNYYLIEKEESVIKTIKQEKDLTKINDSLKLTSSELTDFQKNFYYLTYRQFETIYDNQKEILIEFDKIFNEILIRRNIKLDPDQEGTGDQQNPNNVEIKMNGKIEWDEEIEWYNIFVGDVLNIKLKNISIEKFKVNEIIKNKDSIYRIYIGIGFFKNDINNSPNNVNCKLILNKTGNEKILSFITDLNKYMFFTDDKIIETKKDYKKNYNFLDIESIKYDLSDENFKKDIIYHDIIKKKIAEIYEKEKGIGNGIILNDIYNKYKTNFKKSIQNKQNKQTGGGPKYHEINNAFSILQEKYHILKIG